MNSILWIEPDKRYLDLQNYCLVILKSDGSIMGNPLPIPSNYVILVDEMSRNPERVFSYDAIADLCGIENYSHKNIQDLVSNIRIKIGLPTQCIKSVYKIGYKFVLVNGIEREEVGEQRQLKTLDLFDTGMIGRLKQMIELSNKLKGNRIVYLSGMHGIGKTILARQFAYENPNLYRHIVYIPLRTNLVDAFFDDSIIGIQEIEFPNIRGVDYRALKRMYFEIKMNWLRKECTRDWLFIIDAIDCFDEDIQSLINLSACFILIVHLPPDKVDGNKCVMLRELEFDDAYQLFRRFYSGTDQNDVDFVGLFEYLFYHPGLIEFFAKQISFTRRTPMEYWDLLKKNNNRLLSEKVSSDVSVSLDDVRGVIIRMFNIQDLNDTENKILTIMYRIRTLPISVRDLAIWINETDSFAMIESLKNKALIEYESSTDSVIISPAVARVLECSGADFNIDFFYIGFMSNYADDDIYELPFNKKHFYAEIATLVYNSITSIDETNIRFVLLYERLLSFTARYEEWRAVSKCLDVYFLSAGSMCQKALHKYISAYSLAGQGCLEESIPLFLCAIDLLEEISCENDLLFMKVYADIGLNMCRSDSDKYNPEFYINKALDILDENKGSIQFWGKTKIRYIVFLSEFYILKHDYNCAKNSLDYAKELMNEFGIEQDDFLLADLLYRYSLMYESLNEYDMAYKSLVDGYQIYINYRPKYSYSHTTHLKRLLYLADKVGDKDGVLKYDRLLEEIKQVLGEYIYSENEDYSGK